VKLVTIQQPFLSNGSANIQERNNSMAKTALKQRSGVFNAVGVEMLSAGQISEF
jgi:hypothetical protein